MDNILLFSKNKDNIKISSEILTPPDFNLGIYSFSGSLDIITRNTRLIIIDICGISTKDVPFYKDFFNKIASFKKPVLVIIDQKQSEIIPSIIEMCDCPVDIVFKQRLVNEIIPRISFILLKFYKLESSGDIISVDGIRLNPEKFELTVDSRPVELTFKEYELLKFLIENKNKVFSRSKLLSMIWGYDFYGGSRTVDVHMRRLRTKLEPYDYILKTVRNVGYMFAPAH
jgi:DNA-binding response OmpR family regulator